MREPNARNKPSLWDIKTNITLTETWGYIMAGVLWGGLKRRDH